MLVYIYIIVIELNKYYSFLYYYEFDFILFKNKISIFKNLVLNLCNCCWVFFFFACEKFGSIEFVDKDFINI